MKILITGATGKMGSLTRTLYSNHEVHLCSRNKIYTSDNEYWIQAEDLENHQWWSNFEYSKSFDIIFHFAEAVKVEILRTRLESIKKSHLNFLLNSVKKSKVIIYPTTAYKYDQNTFTPYSNYLEIKEAVTANIPQNNNIKCPIFHPLTDYGDGLSKLIKLSKNIPLFNIFFSFKNTLPVLHKSDLERYILNSINASEKFPDVYSEIMSISSIFNNDNKINSTIVSNFTYLVMRTLNHPKFYLLLNGREIPRERHCPILNFEKY